MFRNYLKTTYRSLRKNLTYTIINILGLGIGLSGVLVTYFLIDYELKFDNQFSDTEQVYRINSSRLLEDEIQKWGITPIPLGPEITNEIPGIKSYTRYGRSNVIIKYEDNIYSENLFYADYNFFDQFKLPLLKGNKSSFNEKNTALISVEFSKKYFGEEESLGKLIEIVINNQTVQSFIVGGIVKKIPLNSSFQFDIIVPYENIFEIYQLEESSWTIKIPSITYLKLDNHITPAQIQDKLKPYILKNNELLEKWKVEDFYLMPFKDQKDESRTLHSAITWVGLPLSALYGSLFMNTVILLIACFNFTNTAIAYAQKRLKEIGIRKTFGGLKKQIITQFLLENFVQSIIALLIAMDLAHRWINWMNIEWPIELRDNYLTNPALVLFLFILLIIVTILSGAYPAFYISKFQPSHILKGDIKFTGSNLFNRILLTLQFGLSMVAIFSGIVLSMNAKFQTELDFGYKKENVIVVPIQDSNDLETYRNAVIILPDIEQVAISGHNVGFNYENIEIDINGEIHHTQRLLTGENYVNTLGLKLINGRDFQPESENDMNESIIVNQQFLETYNIQNPLSQSIKIEGKIYYIIGIIKNYMPIGLFSPIMPVILNKIPDDKCSLLCINADPEKVPELNNTLEDIWKKLYPNKPYEGYFQEEFSNQAENINSGILKQFGILGLFALFLSTAGMYSMVSLNINRRTKEIGIRKVLGASIPHIMKILNKEFLIILAISSIFGTVLGYYFMEAFLNDVFEYYLDIGPGVFIISISVIVLAALLTSGRKIYRASHLNPVDSLKYE